MNGVIVRAAGGASWGDWISTLGFLNAAQLKVLNELIEATTLAERERCKRAMASATHQRCACGGSGPNDEDACSMCLAYHDATAIIDASKE